MSDAAGALLDVDIAVLSQLPHGIGGLAKKLGEDPRRRSYHASERA
jgi:hypothetical protein